jgi:16S rRNA (guanine966-N2)-methyltransferase
MKKTPPSRVPTPRLPPPQQVRIIGGQWRRTPLPVATVEGLRPTPARVRETVFNWLGQDLTGWHCIDVFAGSGALGFEAASRGAAAVTLVEHDTALVRSLQGVALKLGATQVRVSRGDGLAVLKHCPSASLDLVFLDPPFASPHYPEALAAAAKALRPDGWIYLEAGRQWRPEELMPLGLECVRFLKAGAVFAHMLRAFDATKFDDLSSHNFLTGAHHGP